MDRGVGVGGAEVFLRVLVLSLVLDDVTLFGTFACGVQRILFASSYD